MQSVRHVKPLLRQETRQKEIYAEDMYGTSPWAGADPTKGLTGQSIRWQFDPDTNQGVCGDWKVGYAATGRCQRTGSPEPL